MIWFTCKNKLVCYVNMFYCSRPGWSSAGHPQVQQGEVRDEQGVCEQQRGPQHGAVHAHHPQHQRGGLR